MIIFVLILAPCHNSAATELFGRFVGTLSLEERGLEQLAKLDLISFRDAENKLKIMAVFALYLGGFNSREYISYHYHDVKYNLLDNSLIFSQNNQDITIRTTKFDKTGIVADIRSNTGNDIGKLRLSQEISPIQKSKKIISVLGGSYEGICAGRPSRINLQTYRSTSDTVRIGNPFGSYEIKGQFAAKIPQLCKSTSPCVNNQILGGSYNFFNGRLTLYGSHKTEQCQIDADGDIRCGTCTYKKQASEIYQYNIPSKRPFKNYRSKAPNLANLQEGRYKGFLYHELRDVYQNMSLNIISYREDEERNYRLSSVANLYFGGFDSNEVLSYRFQDQIVSILRDRIVLQRTENDVDAIIKITEVSKSFVKGSWYSILFGKVGTFFVTRNAVPELPNIQPLMKSLTSEFKSKNFFLDLDIFLGQTPYNTENPFFPLQLSGYFAYRNGITSRIMITGGSYDFYTGKIGIEVQNGRRVSTGMVNNFTSNMNLRWSSRGFATQMQDFDLRDFSRSSE